MNMYTYVIGFGECWRSERHLRSFSSLAPETTAILEGVGRERIAVKDLWRSVTDIAHKELVYLNRIYGFQNPEPSKVPMCHEAAAPALDVQD